MNISTFKLGKKPARHDRRTLVFAKYAVSLPPPPAAVDWTAAMSFPCGQYLNDQLGDCTCAGLAHAIQVLTANANPPEVSIPDSEVETAYEGACGYNPRDPSTDQGGVLIDVLNYTRTTGIGGHKFSAYTAVNVLNQGEVMEALQLFGVLYTGVMLPVSAQSQVGEVWDVTVGPDAAPGSWGGHCVVIAQADATGLTCITWGEKQRISWAFWNRYFDEGFAIISPDWIEKNGLAPSGFDLATLQADLAEVTA